MLSIVGEATFGVEAQHRDLLDLLQVRAEIVRYAPQHFTITAKTDAVPVAQFRAQQFSINQQRDHGFSSHAVEAVGADITGKRKHAIVIDTESGVRVGGADPRSTSYAIGW